MICPWCGKEPTNITNSIDGWKRTCKNTGHIIHFEYRNDSEAFCIYSLGIPEISVMKLHNESYATSYIYNKRNIKWMPEDLIKNLNINEIIDLIKTERILK